MLRIMIIWTTSLAFVLLSQSCNAEEKAHIPEVPYYFGDVAHYYVPPRPIEELSQEEAKARKIYFVAYYDAQNRIILFSNYFQGKLEFSSKFFYGPAGGLQRQEATNEKGETIIYYYDDNGKLIKSVPVVK